MLKKLTKLFYKKRISSKNIENFADFFQYQYGLELMLNLRLLLYVIIYIGMALLFYNTKILAYIALGVITVVLLYNLIDMKKHIFIGTPKLILGSMKLKNWIIGHCVLQKQFLTKEEWKKVKKKDRHLYDSLVSGYSIHKCHTYALLLALQLDDAYLVYLSAKDPQDDNDNYAHAVVMRNGAVFDTNFRRVFDVEDYYTLFNVKVYHIWNYHEYSEPNFKEKVSKDFHNWCKENKINSYQYF